MITVKRFKLAYWPIPKNACTSMKEALYLLDTGRTFEQDYQPQEFHIHHIYPASSDGGMYPKWVNDQYFKFIIVRDPLERFVSAFSNRIVYHGDLMKLKMDEGLRKACEQDINEFAKRFGFFLRKSNSVLHHFQPQDRYVRNVIKHADMVADIKKIDQLVACVKKQAPEFSMAHRQTGNAKESGSNIKLSGWNEFKLRKYYCKDYLMLRPYLV